MRQALTYGGVALALLIGGLWLSGALGGAVDLLHAAQRLTQDRLAGAIRSLRGGEPGALAAFWAVCFGYGVLHAAGPGHGKLVIGGYGVARRVPVARLMALALASSVAQAAVAVALVYALVAALGLTRGAVEGAAERWMTPFGHAMIAGLGLWLVWRGVGGLRRQVRTSAGGADGQGHHHDAHVVHHHSGHGHGHDGHAHAHHQHDDHRVHGPQCNHAHGPTLDEVDRVTSWRDAAALIAGIAIRPCAGALFVLILTWQLGIALAGVIGAFVMGLGTALVTMAVALLAIWTREGVLAGSGAGRAVQVLPWLELAVGAVIALAALGLLLQGF